ncbi:hypothetical protein SMD22_01020 (plasmid) [Brevibacillus halotolerans]|nr:hypothetical protein SMD22_01020 [Brevibacillus halotolerans]
MVNLFNVNPEMESLIKMVFDSSLLRQMEEYKTWNRRDNNTALACMAMAYPNLDIDFSPKNVPTFLVNYRPSLELIKEIEDVLEYLKDIHLTSAMKRGMNFNLIFLLAKESKMKGMSANRFIDRVNSFFTDRKSFDYKKYESFAPGWSKSFQMQSRLKILREALLKKD